MRLSLMHLILLAALGSGLFIFLIICLYLIQDHFCGSQSTRNTDEDEPFVHPPIPVIRRPSAPDVTHLPRNCSFDSVGSISDPNVRVENMKVVQKHLLELKAQHTEEGSTSQQLIISVFASSTTVAGYCINENEKRVSFYVLSAEDLPCHLSAFRENSEVEMKNFLFALLLWSKEIKEVRKLFVYTANPSINNDSNRYGRRAAKLLEHYSTCEGIGVLNDCRNCINWKIDPKSYSQHILPAEDLSNWNFVDFQNFIKYFYGIECEHFSGTHVIPQVIDNHHHPLMKYAETENYNVYIDQVRSEMEKWTEPCRKCGYIDDETASMMSINRIAY